MSGAVMDSPVYGAVADPTRRAILDLLRTGEKTVNALLAGFSMTQSALSQHLAVLRKAGLVTFRKAGRQRFYALSATPLRDVSDWLAHYQRFWDKNLERLGDYLEREHGRRKTRR
ncbi:MAG: winged helix-turn-helix transcriptional regulator [Phycisphaerales bacterium]|nr:winged helix-turn-helix transcriptional regulator [Phycisphaerales bacterium]